MIGVLQAVAAMARFGQAAVVGRQQCPRWLREGPHHRRGSVSPGKEETRQKATVLCRLGAHANCCLWGGIRRMDLEEDRALNTTGGRVCKRVSEVGVGREGAGESKATYTRAGAQPHEKLDLLHQV